MVRSLSINAAAYDPVLGTLSVNATVCKSMELVAALGSALLRKSGALSLIWYRPLGHPFLRHTSMWLVFGIGLAREKDSAFVTDTSPGAPVDVAPGGDLRAKLPCGNHPSSESHTGAIRAETVQDVGNRRVLAFKRSFVSDIGDLHVSPLGAVEARKLRIIHDLTFAGNGYRSSVNNDADFSATPPCELGHVFGDVCRRILYFHHRHSAVAHVMLCGIMSKTRSARFP